MDFTFSEARGEDSGSWCMRGTFRVPGSRCLRWNDSRVPSRHPTSAESPRGQPPDAYRPPARYRHGLTGRHRKNPADRPGRYGEGARANGRGQGEGHGRGHGETGWKIPRCHRKIQALRRPSWRSSGHGGECDAASLRAWAAMPSSIADRCRAKMRPLFARVPPVGMVAHGPPCLVSRARDPVRADGVPAEKLEPHIAHAADVLHHGERATASSSAITALAAGAFRSLLGSALRALRCPPWRPQ